MELVKYVYDLTKKFPKEELYGLTLQIRKAVVSIPSNIAEGQARRTTGDYIRFVSNAEGSLAELDTQVIIAIELEYVDSEEVKGHFELMDEIRRMLNALRRSLLAKSATGTN